MAATEALGGSQRDCVPGTDLICLLLKMPSPCNGQDGPIGEAGPGKTMCTLSKAVMSVPRLRVTPALASSTE